MNIAKFSCSRILPLVKISCTWIAYGPNRQNFPVLQYNLILIGTFQAKTHWEEREHEYYRMGKEVEYVLKQNKKLQEQVRRETDLVIVGYWREKPYTIQRNSNYLIHMGLRNKIYSYITFRHRSTFLWVHLQGLSLFLKYTIKLFWVIREKAPPQYNQMISGLSPIKDG